MMLIGAIVAVLLAAGVIVMMSNSGDSGGPDS